VLRAIAATGAIALLLAAAPCSQAAKDPCHPPDSRTVHGKDNGEVRVYRLPDPEAGGPRIWACLRRSGARTSLGHRKFDNSEWEDIGPIRLRGPIVGWLDRGHDREHGWYRARSRDLARGKLLHAHDADPSDDGCTRCLYGWDALRLVMDRAGSIAWTAEGALSNSAVRHVFKADSDRRGTAIDTDASIDPWSLRRRRRTISWVHGAETRTFRLAR
jgi:hypothetical protein